jgi:hypothetical protein
MARAAVLDRKVLEAGVARMLERVRSGTGPRSYSPILPLLLNLKGRPYTLKNHFPFEPGFAITQPKMMTLKAGRQVSKSTYLAASGAVNCVANPFFSILFLTPLFDQIRRFSSGYVRQFIDTSPIKGLMVDAKVDQSVLHRQFINHAAMNFSFAFLDAERTRGYSVDHLKIDEFQDFDLTFVPIIRETMSHSQYRMETFSGTPKTIDGPLEVVWQDSSMSEWFIPCREAGCGEWNIPSLDYHLLKMIGPMRDDISAKAPGVICHKCRKPLNPRDGGWVPRHREKQHTHLGLHLPQIIMPVHYEKPDRWAELLAKQNGAQNTASHVFYNEILGESYDSGSKLVSLTEIKAACVLPWRNNGREPNDQIFNRLSGYLYTALGVDWGGGGVAGVSFTTIALLGLRHDGKVDVLWGVRLLTPNDHPREALEILGWFKRFRPRFVAHDFTGAGATRETIMLQAGMPLEQVIPVRYAAASSGPMMKHVEPTDIQPRDIYRLDKSRSLQTTLSGIRFGFINFFEYDRDYAPPGLLHDFLALVEEKTESRQAGDIYVIRLAKGQSDDFAQAVNIGACALWYVSGLWPDFAKAINAQSITAAQEDYLRNGDPNWKGEY